MSDHHPDWETGYAFTLTVTEAATVLRISRSTAYALVATGAVPSIKLGRRIVVPIRPLAEMLVLSLYDLQLVLGRVRRPCGVQPKLRPSGAGSADRAPTSPIQRMSGASLTTADPTTAARLGDASGS